MEPVIGIPLGRVVPRPFVLRETRQDVIDQINHILQGHTISSNTEEPDVPIKFCLDEYGDVDIDPT